MAFHTGVVDSGSPGQISCSNGKIISVGNDIQMFRVSEKLRRTPKNRPQFVMSYRETNDFEIFWDFYLTIDLMTFWYVFEVPPMNQVAKPWDSMGLRFTSRHCPPKLAKSADFL